MKRQVALTLLVSLWLIVAVCVATSSLLSTSDSSDSDEGAQQEGEGSSKQQQEGSWSHWWSYDGISGPDYWNINKRWRLCSLGRKQSPIELRTDRLVYDHLLGPLHLSWLPAGAAIVSDELEQTGGATLGDRGSARGSPKREDDSQKRPVKVQLLNSGRGLEVWLEAGVGGAKRPAPALNHQDQLILSRGPLSYSYKLFKIELHSAATVDPQPARPKLSSSGTQKHRVRSSEHLIDGRSFDGELQLHFYNKHLASSAAEAQHQANEEAKPNLFAAIGVFIVAKSSTGQLQQSAASRDPANRYVQQQQQQNASAIDFMLDNLVKLQNEGNSMELELNRRHIESLVPNKRHYVTYQGSINRPPCAESVDWILVNKALRVDANKFRSLFLHLNTNQENVRPIKPLNRRLLRTSINLLANNDPSADLDEVEDDDQYLNQELKTSSSQLRVVQGGCPVGNMQNCSSSRSNGSDKQQQQQLVNGADSDSLAGMKRGDKSGIGSCSMRPRYAYQLTSNLHNNNELTI